ncbi:MAG: YoaK family protein [Isosphaeraceae bacterium]
MRTDVFRDVYDRRNRILWLTLAFQGGFMNAGGFLVCGQFVSHITGYGTQVGMSMASQGLYAALEIGLAPLFFLAGALFAGWLVDRRLTQGREPMLRLGIIALATLNLVVFSGEELGLLGEFGENLVFQRDYILLFSLCFACGLQNGLFTSLTGGLVRTTHLTGPTTDVGLALTRLMAMGPGDPERGKLASTTWLRGQNIAAFSAGSMIATPVFTVLSYAGFALPFTTSLFLVAYIHWRLSGPPERRANREPIDGALKAPVSVPRPE